MFKYVTFKTNRNYYLYDGVTGNIFEIDELFYINHDKIFNSITNTKTYETLTPSLKEKVDELIYSHSNGFIQEISDNLGTYWFDENEYLKNFDSDMCQLMIGITEKCNMRCKYCIYGGHYENERNHSEKNISNDTLKKAIDYFYKISKNKNKIINFYGGEPFVNFKCIKESVKYINSIDHFAKFYITTNGTLLSPEILKWFSDNKNVTLYVSLAATPKTHDELRVFKNELPTFSVIKKNILNLKSIDFEAYSKRVHFIFNIFDDFQLFEIQKFWDTDELFKGNECLPEITYIDCYGDDGAISLLQQKVLAEKPKDINILNEYISRLKNKDMNNIITNHYDNKFLRIHRRNDNTNNIFSGVCRPFAKKLFVDIQGNVHMCENFVNGDNFGNINENFSKENISKLLIKYKHARGNNCRNCWASKLCSLCYRDIIDRDGSINLIRGKDICDNEQAAIISLLEEYCEVMESETGILDHLYHYEVYN